YRRGLEPHGEPVRPGDLLFQRVGPARFRPDRGEVPAHRASDVRRLGGEELQRGPPRRDLGQPADARPHDLRAAHLPAGRGGHIHAARHALFAGVMPANQGQGEETMETIRVAAVSMNSLLGQPQRNLATIAEWCEQAAGEKAELVVFPELVVHGHCTPNTWELAEAIPEGPSVQRLIELARRYGLILSVGLSEKERDIVYNAQVLVGPQGYIGKQRKLHPSRDEVMLYKGGREIVVFDLGKCKVGTVICYDNWFPEIARILALRSADVILMPHAARE